MKNDYIVVYVGMMINGAWACIYLSMVCLQAEKETVQFASQQSLSY